MSVRHAVLALLSSGPKYGLQLRNGFEARTGEVWPLNVGQVYTTLQRLERDGLVEADGSGEQGGPPKGFRFTGGGRQGASPRGALGIKVLVAVRAPDVDVHEVIQVHRRYLVQLMQEWTRLKQDETDVDVSFALVVDAELFRLDPVIR